MSFLPTNLSEAKQRGWSELDIIIITGDAYIDHPSFGAAIISRFLEAAGFKVGIISQPNWQTDQDFLVLGKPRLFFGITSGNMDSMVNHYTAQRKLRSDDAYSPNGVSGKRPDRALIIYANIIKRLFKGVPIVCGGIEASLRRIAHYDYWQDKVRNSVLSDTKADILVYGMAEKPILEIANGIRSGLTISELSELSSTVSYVKAPPPDSLVLPDSAACKDKHVFHRMTHLFTENFQSIPLFQLNGGRWLRHNPPESGLSQRDMDTVYSLPYMRAPHPMYGSSVIPAWEQIKNSITSHRGCFGGCNFCAIAAHQGRQIQSRSGNSIISEAKTISKVISDVGGPTANMYANKCKLDFPTSCKRRSCIYPEICPNLLMDHETQLNLLDKLSRLPNIKHVYIASGIRHDMAIRSRKYIDAIAKKFTGGRLKLAPEHSSARVLALMGKPSIDCFEAFSKEYFQSVKKAGLKRQIVPYLIVGHPGSTLEDALELKNWLRKHQIVVEQIQEFTPTPMTISTCMYYTGLDFESGTPIHIPSPHEVRKQKKLILD